VLSAILIELSLARVELSLQCSNEIPDLAGRNEDLDAAISDENEAVTLGAMGSVGLHMGPFLIELGQLVAPSMFVALAGRPDCRPVEYRGQLFSCAVTSDESTQ